VIEAWQVHPDDGHTRELPPQWLLEGLVRGTVLVHPGKEGGVSIKTLEGTMRGNVGDWIIQGVTGELYPCKPDIFAATYEPVTV
jgi:hypothetical protein